MLPILITFSVMVASATLIETALSFMELGDSNTVSWGRVIGAGRELLRTAWELTTLPGLLIVVTVLALKLIGDGLLGTWASLQTGSPPPPSTATSV
ncbi:hypothetical protein ACIU1J_23865 [Azospirillum doebereinerae]|uniref:hypothetical protein n=1 Tax=Azospirillum doebereinerae TaxID=92933 RepID=UPI001EE59158|nr:hypothetical protein [Azospirillum doebereinerae]MCG5238818.1 hypothetical protein [Azospirillum doebereinerae]